MGKYDTTQLLVFTGFVTVVGVVVMYFVRKIAGKNYNEKHHLLWTALALAITGLLLGLYSQMNS